MLHKAVLTSWPLFFGLLMMMMGNGLQGTLLGVRATIEDFSTLTIGVIMTLYYVGYFLGSQIAPKLILKVGHIRVFAAFASLASTTVLMNGLFLDPILWGVMRVITGFSYAGLFIIIESWLNNSATNKTRGQIMALYMAILYIGMVLGQFMLNISSPEGMELFVLTSVLVSLALLPISLSTRPAPDFQEPETISLRTLWEKSPLGVWGVCVAGLIAATLFSILPVYATRIGLGYSAVSLYMAAFVFGGIAFQIPVGQLSDRYDRRKILVALASVASLLCLVAAITTALSFLVQLIIIFLIGGMTLTIYSTSVAHANDHLGPKQILAGSASLIVMNGLASCFGPVGISALMSLFGPLAFFLSLAVILCSITVFGVFRMRVSDPVPLEDQGDHTILPIRPSPIVMQIMEDSADTLRRMDEREKPSSL